MRMLVSVLVIALMAPCSRVLSQAPTAAHRYDITLQARWMLDPRQSQTMVQSSLRLAF
jgi:hypothetical protein